MHPTTAENCLVSLGITFIASTITWLIAAIVTAIILTLATIVVTLFVESRPKHVYGCL